MNIVEKSIIASVVTFNALFCFSCGVKTNPGSLEDSNLTYSGLSARLQGIHYPVYPKPDYFYVMDNNNNFPSQSLLTIPNLQAFLVQAKQRIYRGGGNPNLNLLI